MTGLAQNGYDEAQVSLGDMYAAGIGAKQSVADAVSWYGRAAERGNATAQLKYGNAFFTGTGVERNLTTAFGWYQRAARQGDPEAMYLLGIFHVGGVAGPRQPQEAYKWFSLAEARGFRRAAEVRHATAGQLNAAEKRAAEQEVAVFVPVPERRP
jgi:TPR repeat protein